MDIPAIENAVRQLLLAIGEDPDRQGLKNTPARLAKMYQDIFSGIGVDPEVDFKLYRLENQDEMILMKDIPFYSMCEHHLLPFWGTVNIAYIPLNNLVTGFSNLVKVVENFAHRPQVQEQMTTDIADFLMKILKPMGVIVIIEAQHMCICMQGVKKEGAKTITSAMRGAFRKTVTRLEALNLFNNK